MLEKGDVDVARNLQPGDFEAVSQNADLATTATPKSTVFYLQPEPEEREPGQARSARGVQVPRRL